MAKTALIQTQFTAGESSPRLLARVDLDTYKWAVKTLTNGLPFYHGGVKRRPGTFWVGEVADSLGAVRFIPFIYSRTQSYLTIFNGDVIQFIKNGDFIRHAPYVVVSFTAAKVGADPTGLANDATVYTANVTIDGVVYPIAVTGSTAQDYTTLLAEINTDLGGDAIASLDTDGNLRITHIDDFETSTLTVADVDLFAALTDFDAVGGQVGPRYSIAHTYTDDELNELRYAQYGSTVWIVHPFHPPAILTRLADTNWTLTDVDFIHRAFTDIWYENSYVRFIITSGSTAFLAGDEWTFTMTSEVAGTPVPDGGNTGNGIMVAEGIIGSGAPDETWTVTCVFADAQRQEWTVTGGTSGEVIHTFKTNNYPSTITFYQQRLWLAGTPFEPQTIWASAVADVTNLSVGTHDSDGMQLILASPSNDLILHLAATAQNLIVMSYANEFTVSSSTGVYTPSNVLASPQTTHGSNLVAPIRVSYDVVFCQRDGKRLRSVSYDIEKSANLARDLTLVSEHITESGLTAMTFQQDPDFVVWAVRNDGDMVSLTYLNEKDVVAWARHTTQGTFLDAKTIPENNTDKTYLAVERTVDGNDVKYVEWIDYELEALTDCAIFGSEVVATDTWTGLDHLEGLEVNIVADGNNHPARTVTAGTITLERPANDVEIGLPYTTTIELLHPEGSVEGGTMQGRQVSMHEIILRLQDTIGCKVNGVEVPFLFVGDPFDEPPALFTGDKRVSAVGWRTPNNVLIEQDLPRPFTLLGVILKLTVND